MDQLSCRQRAALSGEHANRPHHGALTGPFKITIGEDKARRFSAQLHDARFDLFRASDQDFARGDRPTGKADQFNLFVPHQRVACLSRAGHQRKDTVGETRFLDEPRKQLGRERGDLRWFDDHAVARGKRRPDFHAERDQWAIPGDNDADNTDRFGRGISQLSACIEGADHFARQLVAPACIVTRPHRREASAPCAHHQRGAAIERRRLGEFLGIGIDQVGEAIEQKSPRFWGSPPPAFTCRFGLGDCLFNFLRACQRDCCLYDPGHRVEVRMRSAGAVAACFSADMQRDIWVCVGQNQCPPSVRPPSAPTGMCGLQTISQPLPSGSAK